MIRVLLGLSVFFALFEPVVAAETKLPPEKLRFAVFGNNGKIFKACDETIHDYLSSDLVRNLGCVIGVNALVVGKSLKGELGPRVSFTLTF